jgi:hypothetical protein
MKRQAMIDSIARYQVGWCPWGDARPLEKQLHNPKLFY